MGQHMKQSCLDINYPWGDISAWFCTEHEKRAAPKLTRKHAYLQLDTTRLFGDSRRKAHFDVWIHTGEEQCPLCWHLAFILDKSRHNKEPREVKDTTVGHTLL